MEAMNPRERQQLTLSMIVKNESRVIARCLESVRPLVTQWVIVDTGSTDGTQKIVESYMGGIPGELHERPWRDFGSNRTEALNLAKKFGRYVLVIDADDTLEIEPGFQLPDLTADAYQLLVRDGTTSYWREQIFDSHLDYRYEGVVHEGLVSSVPRRHEHLMGVVYRRKIEGARSSDPDKYRKDAAILERALARDRSSTRHAFYLAQSWRDAGEDEKARDAYRVRAQMGGWDEEIWYSRLEIAKLSAKLGDPEAEVISAYIAAYETRPSRAESLCYLAMYLRTRGRVQAAYPFARAAAEASLPSDLLFVDESVYSWRARDELAVSAYWTQHYDVALASNDHLLASADLPESERPRIIANRAFCLSKLGKT